MASGGITGEPVQTARIGSYMTSTGGGKKSNTVTQRTTSGGGSTTKANTADRQLNNLVNKSRGDSDYRNRSNVYTVNEILADNNPLNLSKREKDFILRAGLRKDGTLNSAGAGRIANKIGGVSQDGRFIGDDRTAYQRDLNNFRISSPANEAAYVRRFPKTAALEKFLRKGAEGIIGTPGRVAKSLANNYIDGVQNIVEKISGTDAKNIEIAKDKETDINTIVNNLQRNIKEERDEDKAKGVSEANLTAMYGEPIDVTTGDDIFGADLLGMDLLEEDSPLNVAPTEGIAQSEAEQKELEGGTQTQGLTPIRLDKFAGTGESEGLFDLSGSDEPGKVSAFDLDPNKSYFDLETNRVITPDKQESIREYAATEQMLQPFGTNQSDLIDQGLIGEQFKAQREGFPDIDVTQEGDFLDRRNELTGTSDFTNRRDLLSNRDLINNPIEGQATAAGQGLVYADGTPIMEQGPTPLFDSDIDEEAIRRAIEGKANGGQIFGNQNMSTFDKLKAIADGIADNK